MAKPCRWNRRPTATRTSTKARAKSADAPSGEFPDESEAGDAEEASDSKRPPHTGHEHRGPDYKAFTQKFDEITSAEDLCEPEELERLRAYLDKQLSNLSSIVARLANRLQRRLMAQQNRSWEFDLEEGMLDAARACRASSSIRSSRCRSSARRTPTSATRS